MARRLTVSLVLAALVLTLAPGIAAASVKGDCDGEATIKGVTYTPANDTPKKAIPIPDEDGVLVTYSGSVGFENKNYSGSAKVQVGPFNITLDKAWSGANEQDDRDVTDNTYALDDFRDKLPIWIPGVWKVTANHTASGGECSGFVMIKLEGNPLGNVVGWIVLIALLALAYAAFKAIAGRRLVSAGIAALFFGVFLAIALMMFAVRPLDTLTVVILPVVLAILAVVASAAMGRRRSMFS
jgi:hypothetical protein